MWSTQKWSREDPLGWVAGVAQRQPQLAVNMGIIDDERMAMIEQTKKCIATIRESTPEERLRYRVCPSRTFSGRTDVAWAHVSRCCCHTRQAQAEHTTQPWLQGYHHTCEVKTCEVKNKKLTGNPYDLQLLLLRYCP
jgi:hypothetical protein